MKKIIFIGYFLFEFLSNSIAQTNPSTHFTASVNLQKATCFEKFIDLNFGSIYYSICGRDTTFYTKQLGSISGKEFTELQGDIKSVLKFILKGGKGIQYNQGLHSFTFTYPSLPLVIKNENGKEMKLKVNQKDSRQIKEGERMALFSFLDGTLTIPANSISGIYKNDAFEIMVNQK